jgi:MFS family permease
VEPTHPLSLPAFRMFLVGRACSGTALTLFRATVLWQIYDLTHQPIALAALGLAQFVPQALASLPAGAAADTFNRRTIAIVAQSLRASVSVAILILMYATAAIPVAAIVAAGMLVSTIGAFEAPARASLLPRIVGLERLSRAVPVHSAIATAAFMTGPAICGFLIAMGGPGLAYACDALLVVLSTLALATLPTAVGEVEEGAMSWRKVLEGLRFVKNQPVVLGCMTLDMMAVIFGGAGALLPAMARDVLHAGPRAYGLLAAAADLGAVAATVLLLGMRPVKRIGPVLLGAVLAYGLAMIAFGLARSVPFAMVAYALAGAADGVSVVMRSTAIQLSTPEELRGRVTSVSTLFIGASNQLGAVESGVVAQLTSTQFSIVSGGALSMLVTAVIAATFPELRRYRGAPVRAPA